ncbi:MAG: hypothetical protein H8E31_01785 [Planctomycetes bacterium]|nr:hypothetical protein [Planctomycetota bacterium]
MLSGLLAAALAAAPIVAQEGGDAPPPPSVLEQLARARGCAPAPPRRLAQHYLFRGTTTFHIGERPPLTQDAEVSVGGPDRLRYVLSAGGNKNVFLLQDRETAWFRTGVGEFEDYGPAEFALQTWMRWITCRFPWDLAELPGELLDGGGLTLEGPLGSSRLELGPDLLPRVLRHADAVLELSGWVTLADGLRMPSTWSWTVGGVRQVERFETLEQNVLLFDRAFAPPLRAPPELQWTGEVASGTESARIGTGSSSVVSRPRVRLLAGPADGAWHAALVEGGAVSKVLWEWLDGRGLAVATAAAVTGELPARLPDGVEAVERAAGLYLRWLSYAPSVDAAVSAASLREGARQGGLEIAGPVWHLRHPDDGRRHRSELLLPVRQP